MRQPTDRAEAWAWWREHAGTHPVDVPAEPQCGFYKTRRKDGSWQPASIELLQDINPETGELLNPERLVCFVGEYEREADVQWSYMASNPITEDEHRRLLSSPRVSDLSREVVT